MSSFVRKGVKIVMSDEVGKTGGQIGFNLTYFEFDRFLGYIKGKILTIVDASFTDPEQRKAVKDLVKNTVNDVGGQVIDYASEKEHTMPMFGGNQYDPI